MKNLSEQQIIFLIQNDPEMMDILKVVESMKLPDWIICAGFIRNKVWDSIHNFKLKTQPSDIDIFFYDSSNKEAGIDIKAKLKKIRPKIDWEIENQAYSHEINNDEKYSCTLDALSKLPETVTATGVKIIDGKIELVAPHGINDLVNCIIRPTPFFYEHPERKQILIERLHQKKQFTKWPKLKVII